VSDARQSERLLGAWRELARKRRERIGRSYPQPGLAAPSIPNREPDFQPLLNAEAKRPTFRTTIVATRRPWIETANCRRAQGGGDSSGGSGAGGTSEAGGSGAGGASSRGGGSVTGVVVDPPVVVVDAVGAGAVV
jgi:hypothetical protein